MECAAPLHEGDETFKCVCLQWATLGSGEGGDDVEKVEERKKLVEAST